VPVVYFITHPDVVVDPAVPAPEWRLSPRGRTRMTSFCDLPFVRSITGVYASNERKAMDGGEILAARNGLTVQVRPALHENDRSATGCHLRNSARRRMRSSLARTKAFGAGKGRRTPRRGSSPAQQASHATKRPAGTSASSSHGGVATLLLCHLLRQPISRTLEQPGTTGGNYFVSDRASLALIHDWKDIGQA